MSRLCSFCLLVAWLAACLADEGAEAAAEGELWTEHYDKESGKMFYYHAESQKTAWEAPAGARVQRAASASAGSAAGGLRATDGSTMMLTVLALGVPVLILFGGLLVIYYQASREGLHEMLKNLKQKRDRSTKRKGSKAGSKYKTKFKLSQDGKGGRSANS